jgi:hypothetical protein
MGFSLHFHVVQVPNYIIASTIVYACGKFLHLTTSRDFVLWELRLILEPF